MTEPTNEELIARRDEVLLAAIARLVNAARGLSFGVDWNKGTSAKAYRKQLLDALPAAEAALHELTEAADRLATLTSEPSDAQIEAAWLAHRKLYNYEDDEPLPKRSELYRAIYLAMQRAGTSG